MSDCLVCGEGYPPGSQSDDLDAWWRRYQDLRTRARDAYETGYRDGGSSEYASVVVMVEEAAGLPDGSGLSDLVAAYIAARTRVAELEESLAKPLRKTILAVLTTMPSEAAPEHLAVMIESQVRAWQALK